MDDEQHRHRSEVRAVLRWRVTEGGEWVADWLSGVAQKRGQAAADRLREDCARQWRLGNRGAAGDWR